jgi:hypothetical protein
MNGHEEDRLTSMEKSIANAVEMTKIIVSVASQCEMCSNQIKQELKKQEVMV